MLDLQRVIDAAKHREPPELTEHSVDLGAGVRCVTRRFRGELRTEYSAHGRLVATAYLGSDKSPRITVEPAKDLGVMDVLLMMATLNYAASRAGQMSFAAFNRPSIQQAESLS